MSDVTTRITCHVEILGRLWMPQCLAATTRDYSIGNGVFEKDARSLDDIEQVIGYETGDFSVVEDYQVTFTIRRTKRGRISGEYITHSRDWVARPWSSEDNYCAFLDCMNPADQEDFE